jgi:hypothetical protein
MRRGLVLASTAALVAFASDAHATETYDSYDAFYAGRPGAVFGEPIPPAKPGVVYSYPGTEGIHTWRQAKLGRQAVSVELGEDHITVNGKNYRYANAVTFPGEHSSPVDPQTANLFLAAQTKSRASVLCMEGSSDGSGEADRHTQIYLLVNPLGSKAKAVFLHLPSLLSSCRGVSTTKDGKLVFPRNSYLFDRAQESRVGLLVSYYTFQDRRFIPTHTEIRLRFDQPEIPFQFSVENND